MVISNIQFQATNFQQAGLINIPDIFYQRFKTGINSIDTLLGGGGFLPGSTFTITGRPGAGKTTLLLQILDALQKNGKMAGYASGEESVYQLAYNCRRLETNDVQIANITDVDDIAKQTENFDILIVDSFQFLTCKHIDKPLCVQKYAIKTLVEAAQQNKCVVGIIQHLTSMGKAKGGTLVPHAVDANIEINMDNADSSLKTIYVSKNRFGAVGEVCLQITEKGFNFEEVIEDRNDDLSPKCLKALKDSNTEEKKVLDFLEENEKADLEFIVGSTQIASWRIPHYLRSLVKNGKLLKVGRGEEAYWTISK